jgi:hypothetical protein
MTLRRHAARAIAALPAGVRQDVRNAVAVARWLRVRASGAAADSYADEFWDFHAGGDWDGFAGLVLELCSPRSLVDVGCGDGKLLKALHRRAPALPLLGIDSSLHGLTRAAGVDVEVHDLSSARPRRLDCLRRRIDAFDVAVSLETAEHLPPWSARSFVKSLARPRMVVFSVAQPDQGGTLHLNERPLSYWRARFDARGYAVAPVDAAFRERLSRLDLPWWYGANIQVFARR